MTEGVSQSTETTVPADAGDEALPPPESAEAVAERARLTDFALLLKPRVMSLVVFSGLTGLLLAPGGIDPITGTIAVLLIAIGAGASGAINMWYDRDIDAHMTRTRNRPIPAGRMQPSHALWVGIVLSVASVIAMELWVNTTAAVLLAVTIAYYVFLYTMWLKRRTPQNIVIGGASGAFPPMIGWAAVTGGMEMGSWVLFAIIFFWTPPHFWALALFRAGDYANAGVPMLPVVKGVQETKKQIVIYSLILVPVTLLPVPIGLSGLIYGLAAAALNVWLLAHTFRVWKDDEGRAARPMFFFSIIYLFLIFTAMLVDRAVSNLIFH